MANIIRRRSSSPGLLGEELLSPRLLRREIDRLFDDFFTPSAVGQQQLGAIEQFIPRMEMSETDKGYLLRVELPGMSEKDVQIEVDDNNMLVVRGEKKKETSESRGGYEYSERSYGQFVRSVQLPSGVDAQQIQANFQNGVLDLNIPRSAASQPRSIPIGKGKGEGAPKQVQAQAQSQPQQREGGDGGTKGREQTGAGRH